MSLLPPAPFTPEGLSDRWACSVDQVRSLCRRGRLRHFTVGKGLYRIPADAVEEYEGCVSNSIGAGGMPSGARKDRPSAVRSAPKIVMLPTGP